MNNPEPAFNHLFQQKTVMPKKRFFSILTLFCRFILPALSLIFIFNSVTLASEPSTVPATLPVRLIIPKIELDSTIIPVGVKQVIVDGKSYPIWETADNEVGWHNLSAPLGQVGNTVLAGHSDVQTKVFQNLNGVDIGDEITVFAGDHNQQSYRYRVSQKLLVQEKGVPVETRLKNAQLIAPTSDERLTLVTCAKPGATHRLIVIALPIS
jgi:LPXTG-site transpeptidase (sortase) family protein